MRCYHILNFDYSPERKLYCLKIQEYNTMTRRPEADRTTTTTPFGRQPGICFRCGGPGHWRADCSVAVAEGVAHNRQISSNLSIFGCKPTANTVDSPVGKLKVCYSHWQDAGANKYMLYIVLNGYKLPFVNLPNSVILRNNTSAVTILLLLRRKYSAY